MEKEQANSTYFLSQWIAGELTDADLKKLVSEEDYNAFLELRKGIEGYKNTFSPKADSFNKIKLRIAQAQKKKGLVHTLFFRIAAAASIVLLLSIFFLPKDEVLYATNFGEHKTILLLDGSEVELNAQAELSYSKKEWKKTRTLSLKGEAFFKVKKGSTFTVNTTLGSVSVVGTQFNVKQENNFLDVVCYEGKVRVKTAQKEVLLTPTKAFRLVSTETTNYIDNDSKPSWLTGNTKFNAVPLKYVISALEKQFQLTIEQQNLNIDTLFTGTITNDDVDLSLKSVFKPMNIQYTLKDKKVVLRQK